MGGALLAETNSAVSFLGWVLGLAIFIGLILWTMSIANRKGRSELGWAIFAFFLPVLALIIVAILPSKRTL